MHQEHRNAITKNKLKLDGSQCVWGHTAI